MSEQIREQISAFLDGELPESETELLLKRLSRDEELRAAFGRYAFLGEVVRNPNSGPWPRSLVAGINRRIDGEPALKPVATTAARARRWWRPIAGAAVAAGVAAVAVVSVERHTSVPLTAATSPVSAPRMLAPVQLASSPALKSDRSREALSYTVPAVAAENLAALPPTRLTSYVLAHSKYSSALGQRNVLSGLVSDQADAVSPAELAEPDLSPAAGGDKSRTGRAATSGSGAPGSDTP
ncbi:MAG: sigma-E factor negative regulatory protein [Proteobacteria bacterium]|nr:sigma-E factor negative regulatory protein [Pseudomonadota bacterium]